MTTQIIIEAILDEQQFNAENNYSTLDRVREYVAQAYDFDNSTNPDLEFDEDPEWLEEFASNADFEADGLQGAIETLCSFYK